MSERRRCPVHGMSDCSPLLNGCSLLTARPTRPIPTVGRDDVVQVVVHGAMFPRLAEWLYAEDYTLMEMTGGNIDPDDLRTFVIGPGELRAGMMSEILPRPGS